MADETTTSDEPSEEKSSSSSGIGDVRGLLRQLVAPVIDQVEEKVSGQIDKEVASRFEELMATRMSTIDRAIGDLDHHIKELTERLDRLEQSPPENPS